MLSPLVPTREFCFLRYCQQIEQGSWAIVDVSYDISRDNQFASQYRSHRLPSGCLIQDMPNGYSKVVKLVIKCVYSSGSSISIKCSLLIPSSQMWEFRLLGWNMWKLKTKLQLIGSTEILFIVGWHLELKDGLLHLRGCVKGLLVLW